MNKLKKVSAGLLLGLSCVLTFAGTAMADESDSTKDTKTTSGSGKICNGVFIGGIDMGGKSKTEAEKLISSYVSKLTKKTVTISANDKSIKTTMADLGYKAAKNDYVDQALNIGTAGSIIQRYKDLKDVEFGKKEYEIKLSYDESKVDKFVKDKIEKCNIEAKEPTMTPKSSSIGGSDIASQFTYSEGQTGSVVKTDDAIKKVKAALKEWNKEDVKIEADVETSKPKYTIDQLKGIDSMLGDFSTKFTNSSSDRAANVSNAASKINGTVVYPGQTFSTLKKITPINESNGYHSAGSYMQGKVVDSVGGGVCQVSTTLYNAVLKSELEIVKRNNHSLVVSYVDFAFDAMIAESSGSDFKFKNNTNTPIYIESSSGGRVLTFKIYGKETRASNRKIKFENKIIKEIEPGEPIKTTDSSKPSGYYKVTQSAHTGYVVELYKIVTVDGVETERSKINTSRYNPSPKYITVGTGSSSKKTNDDNEGQISEDDPPLANEPTTTKKPEATKKPDTSATNKPAA